MNALPMQRGFTLVEMSIALVIIALLIGGMLTPLATQKEQQRRSENQQLLEQARDALYGFAVVNGYLPCPDTDGDGLENTGPNPGDCGRQTAGADRFYPNGRPGRLPWVTLGVDAQFDPWGESHFVRYAVNGAFVGDPTDGTFTLNASGTGTGIIEIHSSAGDCGSAVNNIVAYNVPALIWSGAKTDYSASSADEAENLDDNDACFVARDYSTRAGAEFDDQMIWLSPSILFNKMISAGVLP